MNALNPARPPSLPAWTRVPLWLAMFFSPTAYILLLMTMDTMQIPAPTEGFVVFLFFAVPVVALVACATVIWQSKMSVAWRIGGLALTTGAMAVQCGFWLVVILSAIAAAISL